MGKVHRSSVGDVALTALQDGSSRWAPLDILREEVDADLSPYMQLVDADGTTELSMTVYVLESQGVRVLVDSGLADQAMPGRGMDVQGLLLECLDQAGIEPAAVDVVVHTHLHFDHVGWNTRPEGDGHVPTFANAKHLIQRPDWTHWVEGSQGFPGPNVERHLRPLEAAGMIELLDGERELTPEITIVPAYGHTPGHQVVRIASAGEAAYILGDSCHVAMQVCEPGWSGRADVDHEQGDATRAALMQRIDDEAAIVIGGQFPSPASAGVWRRTDAASSSPSCSYVC